MRSTTPNRRRTDGASHEDSGRRTKRAVVVDGLRLIACIRKQTRALKKLKGLGWEGDLDTMRQGWPPRPS
jgi:hypothetical protein